MPEEQETIIDSGEASQPEAVIQTSTDDLISTVDVPLPTKETPPEEAKKTEEDDKTEDKGKEAETEEKPEKKADEDRFDKHPRFQELITGRREDKDNIATLTQQIEALQKPQKEEKPAYKDMGAMTNEQLTEWQEDNPQEYVKNLSQQIRDEVRQEVLGEVTQNLEAQREQAEQKAIEKTYVTYAKDNPDFDGMWDSGELKSYMDENPGHTAISAHQMLTMEKRLQDAVEGATKEADKKAASNLKVKQKARVLGSGPAAGGKVVGQIPAELKDTKKYGGLTKVLADRSMARTSQAS